MSTRFGFFVGHSANSIVLETTFICSFMSMRFGTCVGHSANSIVFETQLVLETQLESSDIA